MTVKENQKKISMNENNNNENKHSKNDEKFRTQISRHSFHRITKKQSSYKTQQSWTPSLTCSSQNDDDYDWDIEAEEDDDFKFDFEFQRDRHKMNKIKMKKTISVFPASLLSDVSTKLQ